MRDTRREIEEISGANSLKGEFFPNDEGVVIRRLTEPKLMVKEILRVAGNQLLRGSSWFANGVTFGVKALLIGALEGELCLRRVFRVGLFCCEDRNQSSFWPRAPTDL